MHGGPEIKAKFDHTFPEGKFGTGYFRYLNVVTGALVFLVAILDLITFGDNRLHIFGLIYLGALVLIAALMLFSDAGNPIITEYCGFIENYIGRGIFNTATAALIFQFPSLNSLVLNIEDGVGLVLLGVGLFYIFYGYTKPSQHGYQVQHDDKHHHGHPEGHGDAHHHHGPIVDVHIAH